jgi:hypothetical protein
MTTGIVNSSLLQAALTGLEFERARLDEAIAEVRAALRQETPAGPLEVVPQQTPQKKRSMSADARHRIALGQKRRWAAVRKETAEPAKQPRKKRKMSAAGRARIIAATKKRWAAFHRAKAA